MRCGKRSSTRRRSTSTSSTPPSWCACPPVTPAAWTSSCSRSTATSGSASPPACPSPRSRSGRARAFSSRWRHRRRGRSGTRWRRRITRCGSCSQRWWSKVSRPPGEIPESHRGRCGRMRGWMMFLHRCNSPCLLLVVPHVHCHRLRVSDQPQKLDHQAVTCGRSARLPVCLSVSFRLSPAAGQLVCLPVSPSSWPSSCPSVHLLQAVTSGWSARLPASSSPHGGSSASSSRPRMLLTSSPSSPSPSRLSPSEPSTRCCSNRSSSSAH